MQLSIVGHHFPGRAFCRPDGSTMENVHVGVQVRRDPWSLVPADRTRATWTVDVDVVHTDGTLDFRGPAVQGRRGERFVYLSWGEVDDQGTFAMFRRLKLHLAPLVEQSTPERVLAAKRIQAVLELTDTRGRPLAASVRPPWVTWRISSR